MINQTTDTILMIRPVAFSGNPQTKANNYFQKPSQGLSPLQIQAHSLEEFNGLVRQLEENDVEVLVFEDTPTPLKPDSIFPNNWVSFHETGEIITYPMFAPNRRLERRQDVVDELKAWFNVTRVIDLSGQEKQGLFLEGTGSLVLDRPAKVAFAALSDRTMPAAISTFENITGFRCFPFHAYQTINGERKPIYHTNVMMYVGEGFATICLEAIDDLSERKTIIDQLKRLGKEIIEISEDQLVSFAGNGLQIRNRKGERLVVMSKAAYQSFYPDQIKKLEIHGRIIYSGLETIEHFGGGSARCMMAEVFLQRNT